MIIHEPETTLENNEVILSARVETDNHAVTFPQSLWYAYPEHYQSNISLRSDTFLAALVLIAQVLGEDLHLKGETSPRLLYGMEQYQQLFHAWNPGLFKQVQLSSEKITHAPPPKYPDQYIAPFSGGVDLFFTLHQALFPEPGLSSWPVTYGLFIHGSPDIALAYADKYQVLAKRYTQLFAELGLELVTIHTNLMQFSAHLIPFGLFLEPPLISTRWGLPRFFLESASRPGKLTSDIEI